jgi:hypothetical protein
MGDYWRDQFRAMEMGGVVEETTAEAAVARRPPAISRTQATFEIGGPLFDEFRRRGLTTRRQVEIGQAWIGAVREAAQRDERVCVWRETTPNLAAEMLA